MAELKFVTTPFGLTLDYSTPPDCDVVILCRHDYELQPFTIRLPHQIYLHDLQQWLKYTDEHGITIIPAKSSDYIEIQKGDIANTEEERHI